MEPLTEEEQRYLKAELESLYHKAKAHGERFGNRNMNVLIRTNRERRLVKAIMRKLDMREAADRLPSM